MKFRNQQGSAHLIIIIVLVVVVLGALGFIFWQNFVNTSTPSGNNDTTSSTARPSSNTAYLMVDQFGVKIPYDKTADTYSVKELSAITADVSSKKADDACGRAVSIGYISHYKIDEKLPDDYPVDGGKTYVEYLKNLPSVTIGDDFYSLQSPQNACADSTTSEGQASNAAQVSASSAFEAAFNKLQDS